MTLKLLQAFGIALAVAGATVVGTGVGPLSTAQAATVRPAVGKP
jgi:hypothetical protein